MSDSTPQQDLSKLEEEFFNFFEDIMYDRGGSPLLGRIYSLCILATSHDELSLGELTASDFVEKFAVNPSTISRNLKELEAWRLIDRRREPGSREWKYKLEGSSFYSFFQLFINQFENILTTLRERSDDLNRISTHWGETLSEESKTRAKAKRILQVISFLIEWTNLVEKELTTFVQMLRDKFLALDMPEKENFVE